MIRSTSRLRYPVARRDHQSILVIGFDFLVGQRHRQSILQSHNRVQPTAPIRDIFFDAMNQQMLQITSQPIGVGQERACYLHPEDAGKVIKVLRGANDKQTRRELILYNNLARRKMRDFKHIPQYYGQLKTNLGQGFVVDLIADYDGTISRSLWWHFEQGYPLAEFMPYLDELRQYLLDNLIIFSVDMGRYNVLFQKISPQKARLVVIDGLGNHSRINWFDNIAWMARRKIRRRWHRFISRLENYSAQMMREYDASPRTLESAYRMTAAFHARVE